MKTASNAQIRDSSFEDFYNAHHHELVRYLKARGASRDDAQDVAQESLIKIVRYQEQPAHVLKILLYRIALNGLCDLRRRGTSRLDSSHVDVDDEKTQIPCDLPQPEHYAENQQELARVRDAISRLPERCREVYLLNRVDGMSYSDISRHFGISVKTVEKHIGKALSSLREQLSTGTVSRPWGTP